jgi:hypothetical protein
MLVLMLLILLLALVLVLLLTRVLLLVLVLGAAHRETLIWCSGQVQPGPVQHQIRRRSLAGARTGQCRFFTALLQWFCSGFAVVLQWCFAVVLRWFCSGVAVVLQRCSPLERLFDYLRSAPRFVFTPGFVLCSHLATPSPSAETDDFSCDNLLLQTSQAHIAGMQTTNPALPVRFYPLTLIDSPDDMGTEQNEPYWCSRGNWWHRRVRKAPLLVASLECMYTGQTEPPWCSSSS